MLVIFNRRNRLQTWRTNWNNPRGQTRAGGIGYPLHRGDKAVSNLWQRLDKLGIVSRIFHGLPQLFHSGVDSVFEVDECVFRPKGSAQLFAGYNLSLCFKKEPQYLEWLLLDRYTHA
jgi:hypothetical protein